MYVIFDEDMENFPEVSKEIEEYLANIGHPGEWKNQEFHSMSICIK